MKVYFYTRSNCPLCEEARLMLNLVREDVDIEIEEIDIEKNEKIHEKYLLRIPVVKYDGKIIQEGRIDYPSLVEAFTL